MIFPNPVNELVNLHWKTEFHSGADVQLNDLSGRTILSQKIDSPITSISTAAIPSGLYLLKIKSDKVEWNTRIIVVHN
jgi:hypothetical protein